MLLYLARRGGESASAVQFRGKKEDAGRTRGVGWDAGIQMAKTHSDKRFTERERERASREGGREHSQDTSCTGTQADGGTG